eukprot:7613108-Pyramimonas_sp.AAC.1
MGIRASSIPNNTRPMMSHSQNKSIMSRMEPCHACRRKDLSKHSAPEMRTDPSVHIGQLPPRANTVHEIMEYDFK